MATFTPGAEFAFKIINHTNDSNVKYNLNFIQTSGILSIPSLAVTGLDGITSPKGSSSVHVLTLPGKTFEKGSYPTLDIRGSVVNFRFWSGGLNQYINILPDNGFHITSDRDNFNAANNGRYRVTVDAGGYSENVSNIFFQVYDN